VFTACALGDAARVKKLLAKDKSLATARDGGLLTALQCCAGSRLGANEARVAAGLLGCARILIDAGADVNATTQSWVHDVAVSYFVIRSGQVEMLRLMLDHGLDATAAISTAAWEGREDILDLLIARGADLDRARDGTRPVFNELVRWGQFTQARLYLSKGANVNVPDDRGWTAVHQVVSRGNLKMLQDILAARGDVNFADHEGKTPRGMAKKSGRPELLKAIDNPR
jgi:ankyrin repeat protein